MPSNHLILCHPLLLLPSIFPSIRVFSNESALCIRWPKYWSFTQTVAGGRGDDKLEKGRGRKGTVQWPCHASSCGPVAQPFPGRELSFA